MANHRPHHKQTQSEIALPRHIASELAILINRGRGRTGPTAWTALADAKHRLQRICGHDRRSFNVALNRYVWEVSR